MPDSLRLNGVVGDAGDGEICGWRRGGVSARSPPPGVIGLAFSGELLHLLMGAAPLGSGWKKQGAFIGCGRWHWDTAAP